MSFVLFVVLISLFLLHEMDAVRVREWKMFIFLKDLKEETAYFVFSIMHLPLYFIILFFLFKVRENNTFIIIFDALMVTHTIVHICFRKHADNGFHPFYSKAIIYMMGILAVIHTVVVLL